MVKTLSLTIRNAQGLITIFHKGGFTVKKMIFLICVCIVMAAPASVVTTEAGAGLETRCGWLDNPTPGNMWLHDRDGEWTIGEQGGYQIEEDWPWPVFKPDEWVKTNGNYGYGCVCMSAKVDYKTHQILQIKSARSRPLAACRQDPALQKWEETIK